MGLLICFFLVVPTVREQARSDAANALVDANEELTNSSANVESLQKQVEQLQSELANYTGKADAVNSYELLMQAQEANGNGDPGSGGDGSGYGQPGSVGRSGQGGLRHDSDGDQRPDSGGKRGDRSESVPERQL